MAKQVVGQAKFQIPGGKATPAPPVGTSLGKFGINLGQFLSQFNERTREFNGTPIPVVVTIYSDRSFEFVTKSPPASALLKKAAGIASESGEPYKTVGKSLTTKVEGVRKKKLAGLNALDRDHARRMIEGTASVMGVEAGEASKLTDASSLQATKSTYLSLRVPKIVREKIHSVNVVEHRGDWSKLWRHATRLHWQILCALDARNELIYKKGDSEFEFVPSLDDYAKEYLDRDVEEQLQSERKSRIEVSESYRFGLKSDVPKGWLGEITLILEKINPKYAARRARRSRQSALAYYAQHMRYVEEEYVLHVLEKPISLSQPLQWEVAATPKSTARKEPLKGLDGLDGIAEAEADAEAVGV